MRVALDLSGVGVVFERAPEPFAKWLARDPQWSEYLREPLGPPLLHGELATCPSRAPVEGEFRPREGTLSLRGGAVSLAGPEGALELDRDGRFRIVVPGPLRERAYWAALNRLQAALAWRLPTRGGALVHAAGIVVGGRAWLLCGPEGAGKSTWAQLACGAGMPALGDDLVLLDGEAGSFVACGTPIRTRDVGGCSPGRFPLAGILFPRHGAEPALERVDGLAAHALLTANLPYVEEGFGRDEALDATLDRLVAAPRRRLVFARDPGFLRLLERELDPDA